jgi:hypothetical protein
MTTIAWCGRYLAADSLRSRNGTRMGHYPKIHAKTADGEFYREEDGRRLAFALTGFPAHREQWIAWYVNGQGKDDLPHAPDTSDLGGWFIVLREGDCPSLRVCSLATPYLVDVAEAPDAWGSGGDLALGAMLAGKSAPEAVAIACGPRGDTGTGGPIRFLDTQNWDAGVQEYDRDLPAVVKELRAVKSDWGGVADPLGVLREIRG